MTHVPIWAESKPACGVNVSHSMEIIRAIIGPDTGDASALQLSARAVILFAVGIVYIRITSHRTFSQASPLDIIVALIIGSNLSRAMTGKAPFFPALAATLVFVVLHRLLAYATMRWPGLGRWLKAEPVVLIRSGAADREAMRRKMISEDDLMESLRLEQVTDIADVKLATLEASGKISVAPKK